jgi:pimeloyl-ACP methyl ester carboxylesterase
MTLQNATPVHAAIKAWSSAFHDQQMAVSGGTQYVRIGGHGPAVLLLHGFGDTGDMWVPLAEILVKDHTVVVPDLRGMGPSSHQDGGYEKTAQARDLAGILDKLGIQNVALVTHDIGNMVGYALAALYPARVTRWVVMDVPLPGIGHWDRQLKHPKAWHFNFRGPDVERLVAGRERASCLIAFTMNCPQPQPASTTRPATITPRCTPYRAPFTMRSADSMRLLPKTRSIIRNW